MYYGKIEPGDYFILKPYIDRDYDIFDNIEMVRIESIFADVVYFTSLDKEPININNFRERIYNLKIKPSSKDYENQLEVTYNSTEGIPCIVEK